MDCSLWQQPPDVLKPSCAAVHFASFHPPFTCSHSVLSNPVRHHHNALVVHLIRITRDKRYRSTAATLHHPDIIWRDDLDVGDGIGEHCTAGRNLELFATLQLI